MATGFCRRSLIILTYCIKGGCSTKSICARATKSSVIVVQYIFTSNFASYRIQDDLEICAALAVIFLNYRNTAKNGIDYERACVHCSVIWITIEHLFCAPSILRVKMRRRYAHNKRVLHKKIIKNIT